MRTHRAAPGAHALHRATRAATALSLLVALGAPTSARAQEDLGEPGVTKTAGGYTVNVNGADLARVLGAIGGRQGFSVVDEGKNRPPLTVSIADAPLDQTLRRLLRSENYAIVYRGGEQRTDIKGDAIERIILLSPAAAAPPGAAKSTTSPLAGPPVASAGAKPGAPVAPGVPAVAPAARQTRLAPADDDEPEAIPVFGTGVKPPQAATDQSPAAAAAAMARMRGAASQPPGDPSASAVADAFGRPQAGVQPAVPHPAPVPARPAAPAPDDDDGE